VKAVTSPAEWFIVPQPSARTACVRSCSCVARRARAPGRTCFFKRRARTPLAHGNDGPAKTVPQIFINGVPVAATKTSRRSIGEALWSILLSEAPRAVSLEP